jgi:hypothetical protein
MFKDLYKILEISFTASQVEIKKSYRKLALKFHPDITSGDKSLEERFKEVQSAYETLSNEDKRKSYDVKYKDYYKLWNGEKDKSEATEEQRATERESPKTTPQIILEKFKALYEAIKSHRKQSLNQNTLISNFRTLFNEHNIAVLRIYDDIEINRKIVQLALICCEKLDYRYQSEVIGLIVKVAGADNEILKTIFEFSKREQYRNYLNVTLSYCARNYKGLFVVGLILLAIISSLFQPDQNKSISRPPSGDLYSDSNKTNTYSSPKDSVASVTSLKNQADYSDWSTTNYSTGNSPSCYNFKPRFDRSINNRLAISVGSNTDAVVKLIDVETDRCIRYSYIRGDDTYTMRHIPQGKYYVKIAYGKDWRQKIVDDRCKGKFVINPLYKKGSEILDFNKIYEGVQTVDGEHYRNYSIPSYSLKLEVVDVDTSSHFQTKAISEDDFNN